MDNEISNGKDPEPQAAQVGTLEDGTPITLQDMTNVFQSNAVASEQLKNFALKRLNAELQKQLKAQAPKVPAEA